MSGSLPAAYFDALYAADPDPWRFATSAYEADKYAATLAALPAPRFTSALEIGCSIGVLTRQLAARCDTLLSLDVSPAALDQARARNADLPTIRFARMQVPRDWPDGRFDLIVASEVLYYLDRADTVATCRRIVDAITPGGTVLLVHWTGPTNYPQTADAAVECFLHAAGAALTPRRQARTDEYRLDLLQRS